MQSTLANALDKQQLETQFDSELTRLKKLGHQAELLKMTIVAFEDNRVRTAFIDHLLKLQLFLGAYTTEIHIPELYPLELRFTAAPGAVTLLPSKISVTINTITNKVQDVIVS
jgi:hypothetical protein